MLYVITSKKKKRVIATKDYNEIAEFIRVNQDARIRTLDYTGKTKIMHRKVFLKKFLDATKKQKEFFELTEILLPINTNNIAFISLMGLLKEFNQFKNNI